MVAYEDKGKSWMNIMFVISALLTGPISDDNTC